MRLMNLNIKNFRGIRDANLDFPNGSRILCIIGPGDSCKSTILKAIEWAFYPQWNLAATDNDFYNGNTDQPIVIAATVGEVPAELIREDKFGLCLRDLEKAMGEGEDDEPVESGMEVLTIRLTIDSSLDPKWEVVTRRSDPKPISKNERGLLAFGSVGLETEKDFQWGRNSILQKIINAKDELHDAYISVMRDAIGKASLESLDSGVQDLEEIGRQYGVGFDGKLCNKLLMQNGSYSTNAGLFDGDVPFSQRGLGSRRLLSIGMNVGAFKNGTLVLLDEVETGLEPYRIVRLINVFRDKLSQSGQLIMTTHSQTTICECKAEELLICRNDGGSVRFKRPVDESRPEDDTAARTIRSVPEAFLSRKVIACEGKTEVGLLRAYDRLVMSGGIGSLAHFGASIVPCGGGDSCIKTAKMLRSCGYDVCILMDSDVPGEDSKKREAESCGIRVFAWDDGNAIEEQAFSDCTAEMAQEMIDYAISEAASYERVASALDQKFEGDGPYVALPSDGSITLSAGITSEQRREIGEVAKNGSGDAAKKGAGEKNHKKKGWFKRVDHGERIGEILFKNYEDISRESGFRKVMDGLTDWVAGDDAE